MAEKEKEVGIAVLVSLVGFFLLGAPSLGYLYLGLVRKGIVYLIASWGSGLLVALIYIAITLTTFGLGAICALPLVFVPLALNIIIVWDVYLLAKGEKPKLPDY